MNAARAVSLTSATLVMLGSRVAASGVASLDLGGAWEVAEAGGGDWFAATVPGCVHTDLLAAGRIPDPFFRDHERQLQWIGEKAWVYRRSFELPAEWLAREHVLLRCEGLDTLASVTLNGREVGRADNMFRTWQFPVKNALQAGTNTIEVRFDPVPPLARAKERERMLPTWTYPGSAYIRKTPCNFGWDWGPTLITCGIWRPVALLAFDTARLDEVLVLQDHSRPGRVGLTVRTAVAPPTAAAAMRARVVVRDPAGKQVASAAGPLAMGHGELALEVAAPRLWWPSGMGEQALYRLEVSLSDEAGATLDSTVKRIGLRTLRALPQGPEGPLRFVVNGVPFFAKGANWIPPDPFPNRVGKERLRRFVADAAAVNMNCLRFWGGGNYEDDELFDACDEAGLCVWFDFKFGCGTYPSFDPAFLESVRAEARDQVKRLRHHPCIAVWCGNNEIMFFRGGEEWTDKAMSEGDYYRLFRDTLGEVVRAHAPQGDYVTGSPDCGDVHFWEVWHGGKTFEAYRTIHGFVSEFGFQSFPVPRTVEAFTWPADRVGVDSPVMKYHMRSGRMYLDAPEDGTTGTDKLLNIVRHYFREPKDFESALWLSQITQAHGIEFGAEGWRREMPSSMGCVYWQYNDTWPGSSWSSVDYFGRWKALHYRARHFFAPLLVSAVADPAGGSAEVWVSSDAMEERRGSLRWQFTDLAGAPLGAGSLPLAIPARHSARVHRLETAALAAKQGAADLLAWLALEVDGRVVGRHLLTLVKPKELELREPGIGVELTGGGASWTVTLRARHPALWAWLDLQGIDARYSDNFLHLCPGEPREIGIDLQQPLTREQFLGALKVRSLFDTYRAEQGH